MENKDSARWLDTMETALVRAETARKDIDLLLVMRALRDIFEGEVRNGIQHEAERVQGKGGRCDQ